MSLLGYVVIFFLFCCSYALNLTALLLPKWLIFVVPKPLYSETNYGLFKLCQSVTGECRPFPREEEGDCTEEGFCQLWQAAGAGMILAAVIGALTLVALLGTMCSSRRKRERGWKLVAGMLVLHAIPAAISMSVVAYLVNTSSIFYAGTRYDMSFIMGAATWCISLVIALSLTLATLLGPPEHGYERLD
ncbi:hypothetical protein J3Q64DRAFT_1767570 [Phycomyces blakesleeanus]|uniref:Uncharacterized protein n=2 Tax=Phycomyces blakesleeanus TaxID=4837 RepID=A0A167N4N0_PHYB8|nr:hypothetical protein PHYBLDRAFT_158559 [Phycomyces blakesleeanus NRRL 1555(-)]OAD74980.1 hypothetical protein PHYBLDRAFT_158559 [Phycomyces blakesleeanus NRRL 1555(-)]|eukprot:XP_018293020.1 hypothetical protein PHYBLDRAFT_158559 [Phycomyces blakesleeanus NRRL 1555(-)]